MLLPLFFLEEADTSRYNEVFKHLKSPVLVFNDESNLPLVDIFLKVLTLSHTVMPMNPKGLQREVPSPSYVAQSLVIIAADPESVSSFLHGWRLWSPREPVLVLVKSTETVSDWLGILWTKLRIVNVVVMLDASTPSYFTWFPYRRYECTTVSTIIKIKEKNLFPLKIPSNLNGCTITAVSSILPPIVIDEHEGLEPKIVQVLGQKLHARMQIVMLPREESVWVPFDAAGNPIRGMKMLWENKADLMFSNLQRAASLSRTAEFTSSHTQDDMSFFVPAPLPASRAMSLFRAFRLEAWMYVTIAFIVLYVSNIVIPKLANENSNPAFITTLATNLNVSFKMPNNRAYRIFYIFSYIYALHITSAYTSCLLVFLSDSPRQKAIKSIQDLIDSGLLVQILIPYRSILQFYPSLDDVLQQPHRAEFMPFLNLPAVKDRESTLLGPRLSYKTTISNDGQYYDEDGLPLVHIIKPSLFSLAMSMYMSIGHPLLPRVNKYLLWMFEAGLPEHYLQELEGHQRSFRRRLSPLAIENVIGAFLLLGILLILSIICFITELSLDMCKNITAVTDWFRTEKSFSKNTSLPTKKQLFRQRRV